MKALYSPLAHAVLSDPAATAALRRFITAPKDARDTIVLAVVDERGLRHVIKPRCVPRPYG